MKDKPVQEKKNLDKGLKRSVGKPACCVSKGGSSSNTTSLPNLDFLRLHNVTKVGLEATGGYEKLCAYTLLSNGFEVYVIQPRWVRDYAKSLGITTKTDKIDCSIISRYIN